MEYDLRYAWRAAPILASVALIVMYTEAMLIPSLPRIQQEFNVTPAEASWVLTIYLVTGTIGAALFGSLGDIFGKKRVLTLVISIYAAAVTLTGFAPSFHLLLAARAIQGLGMAMFPLAFSLIREEFPPRLVPVAQGVVSAMFGVGIVISLPVGAYIAQEYGWRGTYHTAMPAVVLEALLIHLYVRESRYRAAREVDWLGIGLFALAVAPFLVAVTQGSHWGWTAPRTLAFFLLSAAAAAVFVLHESTARSPFIPRGIFNRNVAASTVAIFMVAYAFQMNNQNLTYLFQMPHPYGYGFTVLQTGLTMAPVAAVQLAVAPLAGRLMWRVGARAMAAAGAVLAIVGYQLANAHLYSGPWTVIGYVALGSTGLTLLNVSLVNLLTFSVPRESLGAATGVNTVFRNLGSAVAPTVAGTVLTNYSSHLVYGSVALSIPAREAYIINFDIATAMFLVSLVPILMSREVLGPAQAAARLPAGARGPPAIRSAQDGH